MKWGGIDEYKKERKEGRRKEVEKERENEEKGWRGLFLFLIPYHGPAAPYLT